jgi:Leucine-rich repeat (LRR) protein
MKHEFIQYLEENFYADFKFYDKYVLDKDGNIIEISIGGADQSLVLPDPKNITDLSVFLPLSPYLKVLHIRNCGLDKDMSPIKAFTHLRELSLSYTNHINKITGLENLTELESLDLSGNKIEKIEGLENLTKLKLLDLSSNGLGYDGYIKKVEGLRSLTRLESLYLHHNEIEEIKDIDTLSNLKKLTLSTRLTEFPDLTSLQALEQLHITGEFHRVERLSELKHLHTIWIESEKEIENMEELVTNRNLVNIEFNSEKIRGDISGLYTHWWDR